MSIDQHYDQQLDTDTVLQRVHQHYPEGASLYQLAPLDQLHIGGIKASERLLRNFNPAQHQQVLDIGSGAGGLMRQAALAGINMIGLDITHALNRLNLGLNTCLSAPVHNSILTADAHHLPIANNCIDLVLFQHSFLNMPDDVQVLRECRRVLKPGGHLVMHEVVSGPAADQMRFPVPWAENSSHSCLLTQTILASRLMESGFDIIRIEDWSQDALTWRRRQLEKEQGPSSKPSPLSPAQVLGSRFKSMGENLVHNLETEAIRVVEVFASATAE